MKREKRDFQEDDDVFSALLFRLGSEWFVLPTYTIKQVAEEMGTNGVPYRQGGVFQGMMSVFGELIICASLEKVLQKTMTMEKSEEATTKRTLVMEKGNKKVAFIVDEVEGLVKLPKPSEESEGIVLSSTEWKGKEVHYLNEESVFTVLIGSANHGDR
jgi:chemotaxis-related protein WspD